jgi:hypothetical protein
VAHPVQTHLDGAVGDPQPPRDRLLGQVLVVAQLDQLTVAIIEPFERRMQVGALDRGDDLLVLGALAALD